MQVVDGYISTYTYCQHHSAVMKVYLNPDVHINWLSIMLTGSGLHGSDPGGRCFTCDVPRWELTTLDHCTRGFQDNTSLSKITRTQPATHGQWSLTFTALIFFKPWRAKGFIQFKIINISVCSFWFIWIPVLCVYDHYKYFTLTEEGSTLVVRIWRLQTSNSED